MPGTKVISAVNGVVRDFNWQKNKAVSPVRGPFLLEGLPQLVGGAAGPALGPCTEEGSRLLPMRIIKSRWKQGLGGKLRFF